MIDGGGIGSPEDEVSAPVVPVRDMRLVDRNHGTGELFVGGRGG